ncbi:MAG TPA: DUF3987 domain-containing protein [Acetobacteraceae bacterium]|nr:DUF3987 domain-containing protein [Acetobacteraceae bacterium]
MSAVSASEPISGNRAASSSRAHLEPDRDELERFVNALFPYAEDDTYVSIRAFLYERDKPPPYIRATRINGHGLQPIVFEAVAAARNSATARWIFAPPVATFTDDKRATEDALANGLAISLDLDDGNPPEALQRLEGLLGPATVVVASGGEIVGPETGEVHPKLHAHWRLSEPTRTAEEHAALKRARRLACLLVGADPTMAPPVHPVRWPGSWHLKDQSKPRLARIVALNDRAEVHLAEALELLEVAAEAAGTQATDNPRPRPSNFEVRPRRELQAPIDIVRSALEILPNPDLHWEVWNTRGLLVYAATGGSLEGLELWKAWSAKSCKHEAGACEARWQRFHCSPPTRGGAGSIFYLARLHGWQHPGYGSKPPGPSYDEMPPWVDGELEPQGAPSPGEDTQAKATRADSGPSGGGWDDPVDFLNDDVHGTPLLEPHHVPNVIWRFATDTAARMGVDPAAVALCAIVCCATVISDDWAVQPKRHDNTWLENARLWGAIVGDPSTLKTPVIAACSRPISKLEEKARARHAEEMRQWRLEEAATKKADKKAAPPKPKCDRFLVEGATIEALSEVLRDDEDSRFRVPCRKVLSRHDEMSEFFGSLDRYRAGGKGGSDRGAYLRLYNGGRYAVDRVGRGSFFVPDWSACFLGGIQPGPIQRVARDAADDGLLQRFMYCVADKQMLGADRKPDHEAVSQYEALFPALMALRPNAVGDDDHVQPVVFHAEAHKHREDIDALVVALSAIPDTSSRMKAALEKCRGLFARLCLTYHLIEIVEAPRLTGKDVRPFAPVIPESVAAKVASYMREIVLPHLRRAENVMFSTAQTGHAQWIAGFILARGTSRITTRDITRAYGALRPPEAARELMAVMGSLVAVGWLEPEAPTNPAKGVTSWQVNPRVHTKFAARAKAEAERRQKAKEHLAEAFAKMRAPKA